MAETSFSNLSAKRRRDALAVAEEQTGRPAHLLEKDVLVVQTMAILFNESFGSDLVLKGGTSLSKAYQVIRRFSEDIDVTYDICTIAPDLVSQPGLDTSGYDPLPSTRSQAKRWSKTINSRLAAWIEEKAAPLIKEGMESEGFDVGVQVEAHRLYVAYKPAFDGHSFVKPQVMVDFGARSSGKPNRNCEIVCDAAAGLPGVALPTARVAVMSAQRTFWEKATAVHVFCLQERLRGDRYARHWCDLVELDRSGYGALSGQDRVTAMAVARHKYMFFRENDRDGNPVDYLDAVSGNLSLIPVGDARAALASDYERMLASGMLLDVGESFEQLLEKCADLEQRTNKLAMKDSYDFSESVKNPYSPAPPATRS